MAGMGIPEEQMVSAVINPETKRPISPHTLRKHFREELNKGFVQSTTKVGLSLFKNATTPTETYPGGIPVAQLFWLKCRARWQQNPERAPPPPQAERPEELDDRETARRMAFLLAKGAAAKEKDDAAKALPAPKKKAKIAA